jgi:hypothetical protein
LLANDAARTHPLRLTCRVRQQAGFYGVSSGQIATLTSHTTAAGYSMHPVYLCRCRLMKIASKMIPPLITLCT